MKSFYIVLTFAAAALTAAAQVRGVAHVPLPFDESGTLNGIEYRIKAPANWNGTLLVYAHERALGQPQVEMAPVAWPVAGASVEDRLLQQGYALAASAYPNNAKLGTLATLSLTEFFNGRVGKPSRSILWGNSLGGLVTLALMEKYPRVYDGGIANCALAAGYPAVEDWTLAWALAYSAVFEWREDLWGPVGDLRDNLNFFTDAAPFLQWPDSFENFVKYEFIRRIVRVAPEAFWGIDPVMGSPFFGEEAWRAFVRSSLEAEAGGPVAQNVGVTYTLSEQDQQELAAMGLDVETALARMNAQTNIMASRPARLYLRHWAEPQGSMSAPVLTMHAIFDGLAPVGEEGVYAARVAARGNSGKLVQAFVNTVGHCAFTADQYLATLGAMNSWLDFGNRPGPAELPASLGFALDFVPPAWPWTGSPTGDAGPK